MSKIVKIPSNLTAVIVGDYIHYSIKKSVLKELENVKNWIEKTVKVEDRQKISASELLNKYNERTENKLRPVDFSKIMDELKYLKIPINKRMFYINISYI